MVVIAGRSDEFGDMGIHYYLAGRHSFRCNHIKVAGSLFHQAFELLFKASVLADLEARYQPSKNSRRSASQNRAAVEGYTVAVDQVRKRLGHDIEKGWRRFKALHPHAALGGPFDDLVRELHRWWRVRYPGFPSGLGVAMTFSPVRIVGPVVEVVEGPPVELFNLSLEAMDELFEAVASLDWSPAHLRSVMTKMSRGDPAPGIAAYEWENRHQINLA